MAQSQGKAFFRIADGPRDVTMLVPAQKFVRMVEAIGIGHPRKSSCNSPVIDAGDKIFAICQPETTQREMSVDQDLHPCRVNLVRNACKSLCYGMTMIHSTYQKAAATCLVTAA